jgi:hypothetical protein
MNENNSRIIEMFVFDICVSGLVFAADVAPISLPMPLCYY